MVYYMNVNISQCKDMEHIKSSNAYLSYYVKLVFSRSKWPRGLRRSRTAARLLQLCVPSRRRQG